MKKEFFQYYVPTTTEFDKLWKECYFVFDTNILINLYEYSSNSKEDILKVFNNIKDRLWEPHQVIDEFFKTRVGTIISQQAIYDEKYKKLEHSINEFKNDIDSKNHPFLPLKYKEEINEQLSADLKNIKKRFEEQKKNCSSLENDLILKELTYLLTNKIGKPYSERDLKNIFKEGAERYNKHIPPGFKDMGKPAYLEFGYGDLIIWKQILDFAKLNKKPIIFVTNDTKEDWWWINNKYTISPRPELIKEIKENSDVSFYMYKLENFLDKYEKYNTKVDSKFEKIKSDTFTEIREMYEKKGQIMLKNNGIMDKVLEIKELYNKTTDGNIPITELNIKLYALTNKRDIIRNEIVDYTLQKNKALKNKTISSIDYYLISLI